jgi:hypothetical protein
MRNLSHWQFFRPRVCVMSTEEVGMSQVAGPDSFDVLDGEIVYFRTPPSNL